MPFDTASNWGDSYGIAAKASPDWNPGGKSSGGAFDAYKDWNPGGSTMERYWDKSGGPSFEQSYTTNWNANPFGFLNNYKDKYQSALAGQSGQGSGSSGGSFGSSGSAGSGFNQLLPGFSMYDPNAGKQAFTVAGVQGGEASPIAKLGLSLAGSVLGPVAGAAGGALAKGLFG